VDWAQAEESESSTQKKISNGLTIMEILKLCFFIMGDLL
jgi:hypothetical protein